MKKMMIFVLMSIIFGLGTLSAQTENAFEGESVSRVSQVNKMKSKLLTKNILAKMIAKSIKISVKKSSWPVTNCASLWLV